MDESHLESSKPSSDPSLVVGDVFADIPMDVAHTVEISIDMPHDSSTEDKDVPSHGLVFLGSDEVPDEVHGVIEPDRSIHGVREEDVSHMDLNLQDASVRQEIEITDFVSDRLANEIATMNRQNPSVISNQVARRDISPSHGIIDSTEIRKHHDESRESVQSEPSILMDLNKLTNQSGEAVSNQPSSSRLSSSKKLSENAQRGVKANSTQPIAGSLVAPSAGSESEVTSSIRIPQNLLLAAAIDSDVTSAASHQQYFVRADTGEIIAGIQSSVNFVLTEGILLHTSVPYSTGEPDGNQSKTDASSAEDKNVQAQKELKQNENVKEKQPSRLPHKHQWSEATMQTALRAVGHGKSVRSAARDYKIPHPTLVTRINKLKFEKSFKRYEPGGDLYNSGPKMEAPRKKPRGKRNSLWTEDQMKAAVRLCREGKSIKQAAKIYGIPVGTLHGRVTGRVKNGGKIGCPTFLTVEEEAQLEKQLLNVIPKGFNTTNELVKKFVSDKVKDRKHPFKKGGPGKKWWMLFLSRHPKVAKKIKKLWEEDKLQFEDRTNHDATTSDISMKEAERVGCKLGDNANNETPLASAVEVLSLCREQVESEFIIGSADAQVESAANDQVLLSNVNSMNLQTGSLLHSAIPVTSEPVTSDPIPGTSDPIPMTSESEHEIVELVLEDNTEGSFNIISRNTNELSLTSDPPSGPTRVSFSGASTSSDFNRHEVQSQSMSAIICNKGDQSLLTSYP